MSSLSVFEDTHPGVALLQTQDGAEIAAALAPFGIRFERWDDVQPPPKDADEATVLATYRPWLDKLMGETGAGSADVLRVNAQTPNKEALRSKFLSEHIHSEDEVRFFVHGGGHFIMHINDRVYDVECTQGDLISVPEGYKHWFDAGPQPDMVTLRIFTHKEGWVAQYTGADIARQFPSFSS